MRKMEQSEGEQVIRVASAVGNGAHVFVPREWLGEKIVVVRLEPKQKPEELVLEKLKDYLQYIEGIYLVGSHARGEATVESDIDVLVILNKSIKIEKVKKLHFMPLIKNKIDEAVKTSPVFIYTILAEAKSILNTGLLDELRKKYRPRQSDFKKYLNETEKIININLELLEDEKEQSFDLNAHAYSSILRLRGLFMIEALLNGKKYSNKSVYSALKVMNVDYNSIYSAYRAVREDRDEKIMLEPSELVKVFSLVRSKLEEIK